jgi:hypothetical protein
MNMPCSFAAKIPLIYPTAFAGSNSITDGPFTLHIIRSHKPSSCTEDLNLFLMTFIKVNPHLQQIAETGSICTIDNNYYKSGNLSLLDSANSRSSFSFFPFPRILNSHHSLQSDDNSSIVVCIQCHNTVFTEPLPSSNKGHTHTNRHTD